MDADPFRFRPVHQDTKKRSDLQTEGDGVGWRTGPAGNAISANTGVQARPGSLGVAGMAVIKPARPVDDRRRGRKLGLGVIGFSAEIVVVAEIVFIVIVWWAGLRASGFEARSAEGRTALGAAGAAGGAGSVGCGWGW